MNHITQKNWLEERLRQYKLFVPFCPTDSLSMLMAEMQVIIFRIEEIRKMPFEEKLQQVIVNFDTKQSKMNPKYE